MDMKIRLLEVIWEVLKHELKRITEKTETKIDDFVVEFIDRLIEGMKKSIEEEQNKGGVNHGKD